VEAVLAAKREHPEWGKQRIADELAKAHGWQPLVSPSEVRRMPIEAGLWSQVARDPGVVGVRHAELPNQTVNTDLCFVPATHQVAEADRLRRQQVQRARYEADLAQRRYLHVDPENRLVADVLEANWNRKLRALAEA